MAQNRESRAVASIVPPPVTTFGVDGGLQQLKTLFPTIYTMKLSENTYLGMTRRTVLHKHTYTRADVSSASCRSCLRKHQSAAENRLKPSSLVHQTGILI